MLGIILPAVIKFQWLFLEQAQFLSRRLHMRPSGQKTALRTASTMCFVPIFRLVSRFW